VNKTGTQRKEIFILSIMLMMASVKTQNSEELMALVCPKGLLVKGISWYYQPIRALCTR